jgi:hypothetical protein
LRGLDHGLEVVPAAEAVLRDLVGVEVSDALQPAVGQQLAGEGRFAGSVGAGNDDENRLATRGRGDGKRL